MDKQSQEPTHSDEDRARHFAHLLVTVAMRESARDGGEQQALVDRAA